MADPDGDPVRNNNALVGTGPVVLPIACVLRDDSNGPGTSADTPSLGQMAPPGPCA